MPLADLPPLPTLQSLTGAGEPTGVSQQTVTKVAYALALILVVLAVVAITGGKRGIDQGVSTVTTVTT